MFVLGGGVNGAKKRSKFTVVQAPASRRRRSRLAGHQRGKGDYPRLTCGRRRIAETIHYSCATVKFLQLDAKVIARNNRLPRKIGFSHRRLQSFDALSEHNVPTRQLIDTSLLTQHNTPPHTKHAAPIDARSRSKGAGNTMSWASCKWALWAVCPLRAKTEIGCLSCASARLAQWPRGTAAVGERTLQMPQAIIRTAISW